MTDLSADLFQKFYRVEISSTLVQGQDNSPIPTLAKPARGAPFPDPVYNTTVVRATDHAADGIPGFARTAYSRRQAFNANSSKLIVNALDGSWHLYDARNFAHVKELSGVDGDAEPQWHPTNADLLYHVPINGGTVLYELNVVTGLRRTIANFAGRLPWPNVAHVWTKSEGSPSADARYWGFMAETAEFATLGFFVYDLQTDLIVAALANSTRPDHVSMSASGNYFIVSWDAPDGTWAYTRDLTTRFRVHHSSEHSDLALDANGDDVYVSVDYSSDGGEVFMVNLRTKARTALFPTYLESTGTAMHFSGKAFRKPGWVLMSTYGNYGGARQWLHQKVFIVQLKASPLVYHLAHHHAVLMGYFTEPHASVNRDFTRVVFNSNWDVASDTDIDAYVIQLAPGAF